MMRLLRRLRYLLQRDRHERELDDELRFHLDMKRQELESGGLDQAAAALAARRVAIMYETPEGTRRLSSSTK